MGSSRVLVVDDHGVVRAGLAALLSQQSDIQVVGQAADGEEAIRLSADLRPDVVVMDVRMPGMGGIQAWRRIAEISPPSRVVFLTSFTDEEALVAAMLAGASGYVLKSLADATLVEAVRAVARRDSVLDPSLCASVAAGMRALAQKAMRTTGAGGLAGCAPEAGGRVPAARSGLTDAELVILRLIADGCTNREIGANLHFTEKTIRNHVSVLLARLGLRNRAEAAAFAVRHDLAQTR